MGLEACLAWAVLRLSFPLELVFYLPPSLAGCFPYTLLARAARASAVVLLGISALAFARLGRGVVPFLDLVASVVAAGVAWIASQQGFVPIIPK